MDSSRIRKWCKATFILFTVILFMRLIVPVSVNAKAIKEKDVNKVISFESTAMELASDMKVGWNLGNGLDAYDFTGGNEEAWGNPVITQDLISTVREAGFKTIRIGITYMNHIGSGPDYIIDPLWMNRVHDVVDYAMNAGFYVIIDIHADGNHDYNNGAWLHPDEPNQTVIKEKYQKVWTQIANQFKNYDANLIFESMNEVMEQGNYDAPQNPGTYENINNYNQIFVDTVRESGSNNESRFLIVPGYNTNIEYTAGDYGFRIPSDTAQNKILVSAHFYDPYDFSLNELNDDVYGWGQEAVNNNDGAVNWHNETSVDNTMMQLKKSFVDKEIPIVIGEFGAVDKSFSNSKNDEYRRYYYEYVSKAVHDINGVPICWDNGWTGDYGLALFNRRDNSVVHQNLIDALMRGTSGENYTIRQPQF